MKKCFFCILSLVFALFPFSFSDAANSNIAVTESSIVPNPTQPTAPLITTAVEATDLPYTTWKIPDNKYAIGAVANPFGTTQLSFEHWANQIWGYSYTILYSKSSDGYSETKSNSVSGTDPFTSTESLSYSGARQNPNYGISVTLKRKFYESNLIRSYYGVGFGLAFYETVRYNIGTSTRTSTSTAPKVVSVSETNFGEAISSNPPIGSVALVMGAHIPLKWFPNILVGVEGSLSYFAPQLRKIETHSVTQAYTETDGVAGTPTSHSESNATVTSDDGGRGSTNSGNGYLFSFFSGNFSLLYTW